MLDIFKRAWNGEASLAVAYWVIYVIFGAIIGFLVAFVLSMMMPNFTYEQHSQLVMAITSPYILYSAICVWRCGKNSWIVWNVIAKILVVLGVLSCVLAIVHELRMLAG